MTTKRLFTDQQFERAYLSQSTVYVRDKYGQTNDILGSLESYNPVFVTVSGRRLLRDDFEFITK